MQRFDWTFVQANADEILSDGFQALKRQQPQDASAVRGEHPCNYLISLEDHPRYIGEGQKAKSRIRQQFRESTSTFYKTYLNRADGKTCAAIGDFRVQVIQTRLGRKELEEFGIVHMISPLNKFQLGKRQKRIAGDRNGLWDKAQERRDQLLAEGEEAMRSATAVPWFDCRPAAVPGLYIVKRGAGTIYVGESSNLVDRHDTHSGRTYFSALRRHIGTELLGYQLAESAGRKRRFSEDQDREVSQFLRECRAAFVPVSFGRYELEDQLIKSHTPALNRKGMLV